MEFREYASRQRGIVRRVLGFFSRVIEAVLEPRLTEQDWQNLLDDLYPQVDDARWESATLARQFYDEMREDYGLGQNDIWRATYDRAWFEEAMEPVRQRVSRPEADATDREEAISRIVKEIENAGRKTIIDGVQNQEPAEEGPPRRPLGTARRWARVATGRETCGFCLMLVSRGPVYLTAETAGANADNTSAEELFQRGDEEALDALMVRWHPNCDCKVVPVYDMNNWEGRDAYLRAEELWAEVTQGLGGRDALNAFRRAVERGDVNIDDLSVAA